MEWNDVVDVLTTVAALDKRTVGEADITVWQAAFKARGVTSRGDALRAVAEHYATSTEWLMPAQVADRMAAMRRARVADLEDVDLVRDVDPDDPHWTRILQARRRAVLDGTPLEQAKAIPARQALRAIGSAS
jgi:hypothetical protein